MKIIQLSIILIATATVLIGEPKPDVIPEKGIWQLDVHLNGHPKLLNIKLPGEEITSCFWYALMTVTNNTGKDIEFYPQAELYTNTFQTLIAGKDIRKTVFDTIRDKYSRTIPFLLSQDRTTTILRQGKDNAKDLVLIFKDFDAKATSVQIFISGLTNESKYVALKSKGENNKNKTKQVLLLKNLQLKYMVTGKHEDLFNRKLRYKNREWIMR
jgi:hypothetical protein